VSQLDYETCEGGGSICISLNDEYSPYFSPGKGLTQVIQCLICFLTPWWMFSLGCLLKRLEKIIFLVS
jgi:hypothetical protein